MITKIKVVVPEKIEERNSKKICDICKKESSYHSRNWGNDSFNVKEVEIKMNEGHAYPDGSFGEYIIYDICPDCFKNKIIPFMDSLGAKPRIEEYSY
jgi:hypothetical protein